MAKTVFSETQDYVICTQVLQGEFHIHCLVFNWTPSILKKLYLEFARLRDYARCSGYEEMYSVSPNPKFCEIFGGHSIGTYKECEVMKWELK